MVEVTSWRRANGWVISGYIEFPSKEASTAFMRATGGKLRVGTQETIVSYVPPKPGQSLSGRSEWTCKSCGCHNYPSRECCRECRKARTSRSEPLGALVSSSLILKGVPSDLDQWTIRSTFQSYSEVKAVRLVHAKRIAFVDFFSVAACYEALSKFRTNEGCVLQGLLDPVTVEFARGSPISLERWESELDIKEQAASILALCPGLEPFNTFYLDSYREWLFDPNNLYWFNYHSKNFYRMQGIGTDHFLCKVDSKTGKFVTSDRDIRPLPATKAKVREPRPVISGGGESTESSKESRNQGQISLLVDVESTVLPGSVTVVKAFVCHLCKRKFTTREALTRHESQSQLHRDNLANLC